MGRSGKWNRPSVAAAWLCSIALSALTAAAGAERPKAYPGEQPAVDLVLSVDGFGTADEAGRVVRLWFRAQSVTDDQLRVIAGLERLQEVDLEDNDITDSALAVLATCPNITKLDLHRTKITDAGLAHLSALKKLKQLALYETEIGNAGLAALGELPELESLYLENTNIGDEGLAYLARFPKLKNLSLKRPPPPLVGENSVASACEAAPADDKAARAVVTDRGLAYIGRCVRLESLYLEHAQITDDGLRRLAGLTRLRDLDLSRTPISGAGLRHLKSLTKLRELRLESTNFNNFSVPTLTVFRHLRWLLLSGADIDDTALPTLAELPELERLNLSYTKITNSGLRHFANSVALQHLSAEGTKVDEVGQQLLKHLLPDCTLEIDQKEKTEAELAVEKERNAFVVKLYQGDRAAFLTGLKKFPDLLHWKNSEYFDKFPEFEGLEPLAFASKDDDLALARYLIELGARPGRPECDALFHVKSLAMAELLVGYKAIVEPATKEGRSPLFTAMNRQIAELYLHHGADLRRVGEEGRTPLHAAVAAGRFDVVRLLVERGAEIDAVHQYYQHSCWGGGGMLESDTPLFLALGEGRLDIAAWLVEHGAKRDLSGQRGDEALEKAVSYGGVDMTRFLIKHGVDPRRKTKASMPIVSTAVKHWGDEVAEMVTTLVDAGADVNAPTPTEGPAPSRSPFEYYQERDTRGWTPLHYAVDDATPEAVRILLQHGADPRTKTVAGLTPLECVDKVFRTYVDSEESQRRTKANVEIRKLLEEATIEAKPKS